MAVPPVEGLTVGVSSKPRRKYRPKPITRNTVSLAMRRAGKVPEQEVEQVMHEYQLAFQKLRESVAGEFEWCLLASAVQVSLAVEEQGVVKGLRGHLDAAMEALNAIERRAMEGGAWSPVQVHMQEIEHVDTFLWLHREQLRHLSDGEWQRAHQRVENLVRGRRGQVIDVKDPWVQEQLHLLGATA